MLILENTIETNNSKIEEFSHPDRVQKNAANFENRATAIAQIEV